MAIHCVVLRKLGRSPEFPRRGGACGWFEQRGTELQPGNSAREHGNPAGEPSDSTSPYGHSIGRNRDSANRAWTKPRLHFAQWKSEHNGARVELSQLPESWKHHTAFNRQSQHNQYTRHFAQRFALWDLARNGKRSVRLHAEHVEPKSADPWKPRQYQPFSRNGPVAGYSVPARSQ